MSSSNNTIKDAKLQSSLQFFHARVKNQLEDVKLQREIRILDRRIGMTNSEFKREFQAVKKEMQSLQKSSGRSKDGWVPDEDVTPGSNSSGGRMNLEKANGKKTSNDSSTRAKSAAVRATAKSGESVWERLNRRPTSAPDGYTRNGRDHGGSSGNEEQRKGEESLKTKKRLNAKTCSKLAWRKRLQEWDSQSSEAVPSDRADAWGNVRPRKVEARVALGRKTTKPGIKGTPEPSKTKRSESEVNNHQFSDTEPEEHIFQTEPQERRPSVSASKILKPSKGRSLRDILEATPISDGQTAQDQWLKSALKTKHNKKREKHVSIMENGELYETDANNNTVENDDNNSLGFGMVASNHKDSKRAPSLGLLTLLMDKSGRTGAMSSPTPNVIPEVRRNPMQSVEDVSLKKRRDTLLKASILSLMGGGLSKHGSSGKGTKDPKDSTEGEVPAGGKASTGRFSFRLLGKAAIARNHLSVQKRSTLGSRLKVRPVLQSAMTAKSIQANLAVYDSDSDDASTPATPVNPDTKSKISKSWRSDSELEKPPILEEDLKQLQIHLAASHLSRERDLQRMQLDQEVDHLKVIDDNRKQNIMSKVTSFTSFLEKQKQKELEEEKRRAIFGGPSQNPVVKRWRNAAKGTINIRS
ncbi:uncharacterized protein [Asterias amurensis]|uniref:uncharacterized protein n=1 Tax=Asterias amurensis TaxID=7602 RepID=UPI003AB68070